MTAANKQWMRFWDSQQVIDDAYLEQHIRHFLGKADDLLDLQPTDIVVDIGSGPGHFAQAVASTVKQVHCVETSTRYVEESRKRLADLDNVHVHQDTPGAPGPYTDFVTGATKIVCNSVIQYFDSSEDFETLLAAVKRVAAPGAVLLVADIRVDNSLLGDIAGSLKGGLHSGLFMQKIRLLLRMCLGKYRTARKSKLQHYSEQFLLDAAARTGGKAQFIDRALTMNAARKHLLVQF